MVCMCSNSELFCHPRHQLFFGLRLVSKEFWHPAVQTKIEKRNSGGFFHQPANRKTVFQVFHANHDLNKQEVGFIFAWSDSELWSLQTFKSEIKISKTYSGWCPFQGLSNDTTLMQIQSGRTVLFKLRYASSWSFWTWLCLPPSQNSTS